jgi:hypothetical protein
MCTYSPFTSISATTPVANRLEILQGEDLMNQMINEQHVAYDKERERGNARIAQFMLQVQPLIDAFNAQEQEFILEYKADSGRRSMALAEVAREMLSDLRVKRKFFMELCNEIGVQPSGDLLAKIDGKIRYAQQVVNRHTPQGRSNQQQSPPTRVQQQSSSSSSSSSSSQRPAAAVLAANVAKRIFCEYCNKDFASAQSMKRHVRTTCKHPQNPQTQQRNKDAVLLLYTARQIESASSGSGSDSGSDSDSSSDSHTSARKRKNPASPRSPQEQASPKRRLE